MTTRKGFMTTIASLACTLLAAPAAAWQPDVHWGLTALLAHRAGFSLEQAYRIANADQGLDEDAVFGGSEFDPLKCPSAVCQAYFILLGSDAQAAEASRLTHRHHFAANTPPPAAADARRVEPNAATPRARVLDAKNEIELGQALHAFQDSWSHGGTPGFYFPVWRRDYQWAHPQEKGAALSTRADRTFIHETQALEMARQTFDLLAASPLNPNGKNARWEAIADVVEACVRADTRKEKEICFSVRDDDARLALLDLVDERFPFAGRLAGKGKRQRAHTVGDVPPEVARRVEEVLAQTALAGPLAWNAALERREDLLRAAPADGEIAATMSPAAQNHILLSALLAERLAAVAATPAASANEPFAAPAVTTLADVISGLDGDSTFTVINVHPDAHRQARYAVALRIAGNANEIVLFGVDEDGGLNTALPPLPLYR